MDRMLYVAMAGAKQTLQAQGMAAHNLANVSTTGFRADLAAFNSLPVQGAGFPTRVNVVSRGEGFDLSTGPIADTGRDLDVAVKGQGWIAVQAADGGEAYTRAGDFHVNTDGLLETGAGHLVLGDGGPISVGGAVQVSVAPDGTVSMVPPGLPATALAVAGRVKLVNPAASLLQKGPDGLIRQRDGNPAPADASVHLQIGALEGSNVDAPTVLVQMIEYSRQFENATRLMRAAEENAQADQRLLSAG